MLFDAKFRINPTESRCWNCNTFYTLSHRDERNAVHEPHEALCPSCNQAVDPTLNWCDNPTCKKCPTHGDKAKGRDLLGVMAADKAEDWGQTKFRYFYHGHLHESGKKEMPGLLIEWFRTLAPADAWAAGEGYRSGRDMCAIVFHKNFGEIERHRCDVAMIQ